ncbi:MAG: NAD-dependent epimerase/dehydratase family protein [Bacteroidia bacterium]
MKFHLVSGGCGFVGRNVAKHLYRTTNDTVIIVDDLSVGVSPANWIAVEDTFGTNEPNSSTSMLELWEGKGHARPDYLDGDAHMEFWGDDDRIVFWQGDFRRFLRYMLSDKAWINKLFGAERFNDVFHFAAIVGGRAKIDGDPMMVALDLAIDAEFFYWAVRHQPDRVLYPSSSAAYPVNLQGETDHTPLAEKDIDWAGGNLGQPDMTYGWSKLTGEYLAQTAAEHYGLSVTCIRPVSGYGEDQDLSYPVPAIAARAAGKEDPFEVWGTGKQGRDFVHIDDVIDCMLFAMDHVKDGSGINIGSGKITSFLEIIDVFTGFAGYKPTVKQLLDKPVGVHARYAQMDYVFNELGWRPKISLEEGMRRVYDQALRNRAKQG